ncbi:TFIID and and SAGA complex TAF10 subunit, putative [Paecilomyces variotii No. 5]|uniref:TFIID and and SAGA complex TAF10 subunit, putative n=1 Tax=Byssochlamys spectabilis (strain No. 5 / NBRC 109023) TaxID=1356009 RepID=V5I2I7_BYSSN|nr:TFIID and and SAGA complex TAF10 subunit, putative [Paecilomyces variotii No. 5]
MPNDTSIYPGNNTHFSRTQHRPTQRKLQPRGKEQQTTETGQRYRTVPQAWLTILLAVMAEPSPSTSQPPATQSAPQSQTQSQETIPSSATAESANSTQDPVPKQEPGAAEGEDIDASIEQDIDMAGTDTNNNAGENGNTNADSTAAAAGSLPVESVAPVPPPTKKETSLREFLGKMDEYAPIIPDAVTAHYLTLAGLPPPGHGPNQTPPHLARLLALATQKFISDIAADAYQYSRIRSSNSSSANNPMGGLNAAAGLMPNAAGAGGAAGAAAGGEAGKGKAGQSNTHLGIQRPGFGGGGQGGSGQGRTVLTMEDLGMAVAEYGVSVKRGEFYR